MNNIRILTSTSLFDGHDASINIMRRVLQEKGAEIIHFGHNRSAQEIVAAAIEEDVQGIAITSYQGGHIEFFTYVRKLLNEAGYQHIKIVGGGGGTILPKEAAYLEKIGISKIYLPEDGLKLGIEGMIEQVIQLCDYTLKDFSPKKLPKLSFAKKIDPRQISRAITLLQNNDSKNSSSKNSSSKNSSKKSTQKTKTTKAKKNIPIIGLTGTGGAGKSTLCDRLIQYFLLANPSKTIAIISVDPSKRKTGGALLGDRIRMNAIDHPNVFMRSLATRSDKNTIAHSMDAIIELLIEAGYDAIVIETAGVGQNDATIVDYVSIPIYVMTPEFGAPTQLEKINMIDYAKLIAINKFDRAGGLDAVRDVRKQYRRSHHIWEDQKNPLPVFGTIASHFSDPGMQAMYNALAAIVYQTHSIKWNPLPWEPSYNENEVKAPTLPNKRNNYLAEIVSTIQKNNQWIEEQKNIASKWYCFQEVLKEPSLKEDKKILKVNQHIEQGIDKEVKQLILDWPAKAAAYKKPFLEIDQKGKKLKQALSFETASGTIIQKVQVPSFKDWGDIAHWHLKENLPGYFPYTAGVFKFKQGNEDPTRMFAGEGCPERTNARFHFLSKGQNSIRLSTAFDSVTLYGHDPEKRLDVYGKIGNAGVNVASIDDAKKLYSGIDLNSSSTSVSMTINGPAPILMAQFFNTAIDQACEKYITANKLWPAVHKKMKLLFKGSTPPEYFNVNKSLNFKDWHNGLGLQLLGVSGDQVLAPAVYNKIKQEVLTNVRGTLQADIFKRRPSTKHLYFLYRFCIKNDGRCASLFC
jgi:methylmalonyl-CoA mutase